MANEIIRNLKTFAGPNIIAKPTVLELVEAGLSWKYLDIIGCHICNFEVELSSCIAWKPGDALEFHICHKNSDNYCFFLERAQDREIRYEEYQTVKRRMETFKKNAWIGWQSHKELANAGLFYRSYGETSTRCFSCKASVTFMSPFQQPWLRHAEMTNTHCSYMAKKKGPYYQETIYKHRLLIRDYLVLKYKEKHRIEDYKEKDANLHVDKDANLQAATVDSAMRTPLVKQAVEFGFERFQIYTVVRRILVTTGTPPTDFDTFFTSLVREKNRNVILNATLILHALGEEDALADEKRVYTLSTVDNILDHSYMPLRIDDNFTYHESTSKRKKLTATAARNNDVKRKVCCKICMMRRARVVCLPCGHLVCCVNCDLTDTNRCMDDRQRPCPVCRASCFRRINLVFVIEKAKEREGMEAETKRLKNICVVCRERQSEICSVECRHLAMCTDCSFKCEECPVCKVRIGQTIKIYI